MLSKSDTNIADVISIFQDLNIDCCFIVPTENGMQKSILDATFQVRDFLKIKVITIMTGSFKEKIIRKLKNAHFLRIQEQSNQKSVCIDQTQRMATQGFGSIL